MGTLKKGDIVEGTVTTIVKYGVFVEFDSGTSGLIHISEIKDGFVEDIHKYFTVGEKVIVKILYNKEKLKLSTKEFDSRFIPQDTKEAVTRSRISNFFLRANRFIDVFETNSRSKEDKSKTKIDKPAFLKKLAIYSANLTNEKTIREIIKYKSLEIGEMKQDGYQCSTFTMTNDYRMVVGLGSTNVMETNLTLHHIYGIPYIPGSSLKGLARAWAIEELHKLTTYEYEKVEKLLDGSEDKLKQDLDQKVLDRINIYQRIFGTEDFAGDICFLDAYPLEKFGINLDYMTPHYKKYYDEMENDNQTNWPVDFDDPNPIPFLVLKNATFKFDLYANLNTKDGQLLLNKAVELLKNGLQNLGIGAKTMVGYGYFEK